ncbi:S-layer homology domain-containing protein [Paenibacillus turicensis]|uniref:S-layer homology domain-containing protein n=1 Tax=Paenibacillus turicensis TaxID=160487 RepID=UPI003D2BFCEC
MKKFPFVFTFLILCVPITTALVYADDSFKDIQQSYAKEAISVLAQNQIIQGYKDHTFRPRNYITRQQCAAIFVRTLNLNTKNMTLSPFKDVPSWSAPYINTLYEGKITTGITNDLFGPKKNMVRQDVAVWYARYLGVKPEVEQIDHVNQLSRFKDQSEISAYARTSVWLMEQLNLMQGDNDNNFKPKEPIQRQEAAMVAYRIWEAGIDLKDSAQRLIDKNKMELNSAEAKETSVKKAENVISNTTPPSNPKPSVPPSNPKPSHPFDFDELRIIGNTLDLNQNNQNYQLTYQFYNKGRKVMLSPTLASDLKITFTDNLGVFKEDGCIKQEDKLPTMGESVLVQLQITDATGKINANATSTIETKPVTISAIRLNTQNIYEAAALNPLTWKSEYQYLDDESNLIPNYKLPRDLQVTIEDDTQVFDQNGKISNLHLIPSVGSTISLKLHVTSLATKTNITSESKLSVIPGDRKQQFFAVSIALYGKNSQATTKEQVIEMRELLSKVDSSLKVTWAIDNDFVFNDDSRPALAQVIQYVDTFGDEIGILATYPNNLHTLQSWQDEMHYWLYMYRYNALNHLHQPVNYNDPTILESIPEQYRPKSLSTYTINPEQANWLKEQFQITSFMGTSATQYNVNDVYSEGSPLMPYWSHINNTLVPAQGTSDNSGALFMNTMTIDPIGSRYTENSSRWTINPGDPLVTESSAIPQLHTAGQYINNPYRELNSINYLSIILDTNSLFKNDHLKEIWLDFINQLPKSPEISVVGVNQLAQIYEAQLGYGNEQAQFSLLFRGSGYTTLDSNFSPSDTQYLWTENAQERIILAKVDGESEWSIIDFTDYTKLPIPLTPYASVGSKVDISYITGRNYKVSPTAPLSTEELTRIHTHLTTIAFSEKVKEL